ncbi:MAG: AAA family ATPase, partial [Dehalococcoidia bacterium]|nr:AAA family ATPase [Dehalococcoidia bacterium]
MRQKSSKTGKRTTKNKLDLTYYQPLPAVYQLRYAILKRVRNGEDIIPEIQGREEAKKDVVRALLSGAHPYLVSEEGTGKTRLAKALTKLLPAVPIIKGCPYHDDPKWPRSLMCPRCRASADPVKEYGIELLPGEKRFSRIQGNEYTNEAKLLGLKDIQAIAQGKSPADPQVFTGTGVFRANRGILFIDELPAIRTKVQVLLHPILEEKRAVLEEYNWEHPLDLLLVATGNPQGFSHVNEVPRPLLDRLELIYMDLPEENVEAEIMMQERFRIKEPFQEEKFEDILHTSMEGIERDVVVPWWLADMVNKSVRFSRVCRWLDKKSSIRGTTKSLDHTYASAEMENRKVARLKDVSSGLKLALRGRIGLRLDLVDLENPRESLHKTDEVIEDMLFNTIEEF